MNHLPVLLCLSLLFILNCKNDSNGSNTPTIPATIGDTVQLRGDVWADNWFSLFLNEQNVKEDSVSINTERSFNKETFTFEATYPFVLNFVVKDYKANDTGLEYIGQPNQQIGDGGLIAQFTDSASNAIVATTDDKWKCKILHTAPLDEACEKESTPVAGTAPCGFTSVDEPEGWKSLTFDDSAWASASTFSESEVRPKDGYDEVQWDGAAKLIWTSDLKLHNTILCRLKVSAP